MGETNGFWKALWENGTKGQNVVYTILDGEGAGEKYLYSDGKRVWPPNMSGDIPEELFKEMTPVTGKGRDAKGRTVFCEISGRKKQIVICGAGHVAIPVIRISRMLGFHVTVLEDRPLFADNARRAGAERVLCESFEAGLDLVEGSDDTYFVIVTRGHRYDLICLKKIAEKKHAYIGMIGSRRRTSIIKENLLADGADPETINSVHTPIGLNIGAETPEEIAVAIMAEIIEIKNRQKRSCGYSEDLLKALTEREEEKNMVLATIISKKGSAPQGLGAKLLVGKDKRCVGTIGGGCMESGVIEEAFLMLTSPGPKLKLCQVDMTGTDAEEEGMVCGGVVEVLLERV